MEVSVQLLAHFSYSETVSLLSVIIRKSQGCPVDSVRLTRSCAFILQITVHRGDECALLNNSQPYKWRVLNDKGSEASVPSICFLVPPTNKDAVNSVAG